MEVLALRVYKRQGLNLLYGSHSCWTENSLLVCKTRPRHFRLHSDIQRLCGSPGQSHCMASPCSSMSRWGGKHAVLLQGVRKKKEKALKPSSWFLELGWVCMRVLFLGKEHMRCTTSLLPLLGTPSLYGIQPSATCLRFNSVPSCSSSPPPWRCKPRHQSDHRSCSGTSTLCCCPRPINLTGHKAMGRNILNHFSELCQCSFVGVWGLQLNMIFPEQKAPVLHESSGDILSCKHKVQYKYHSCFCVHQTQGNLSHFPKVPSVHTLSGSHRNWQCYFLHAVTLRQEQGIVVHSTVRSNSPQNAEKRGKVEQERDGGEGEEWPLLQVLRKMTLQWTSTSLKTNWESALEWAGMAKWVGDSREFGGLGECVLWHWHSTCVWSWQKLCFDSLDHEIDGE